MILKYSTPREGDSLPTIHKWTRRGGKRHYEQLPSFSPYFYVEKEVDVEKALGNLSYLCIGVEETDKTTIEGNKLQKVLCRKPKDVGMIRELFDRHWEADIPFTTRFLIDSLTLQDFGEEYLPMYLDVELGMPTGASFDGDYPIICMSTMCEGELKSYRNVGDEGLMLSAFLRDFKRYDPDMICGWSIGFDVEWIIKRLGHRARELSPLGYVHGGEDPSIPGRIIFDLYSAYKKMMINAPVKPRNYSLNTVAGFEFPEHPWASNMPPWSRRILEIYNNNPADAVEYNQHHTTLCQMIDEKYSLVQTFTERQRIALCEFRDTKYDSAMFDRLLLRKSPYVLPSKPKKDSVKKVDYAGGVVFEPSKGIHKEVCVFDVKSMYPSIVQSLNISPETVTLDKEEADFWLGEIKVGFKAEPTGLIPTIIKDLLDERAKVRKLSKKKGDKYDCMQYALKVLANVGSYGVHGFPWFRLYNPNIAKSITFAGRSTIISTREYLQAMGYETIYSDTDSVLVKDVDNPHELTTMINEHISDWIEEQFGVKGSQIEIEYETKYKAIFFGKVKKRYAGLDENGELIIKGLETKRRDCPLFGQNLQRKIMRMALEGMGRREVTEKARDVLEKLKAGAYTLQEMGIPKGLSQPISEYKEHPTTGKIFPWAQAVLDTNQELHTNYTGQEDELYFLYTTKGIRACVTGDEEIYSDYPLDVPKMIDMGIIRRVKALYEALEWDVDSIVLGHSQTKLEACLE